MRQLRSNCCEYFDCCRLRVFLDWLLENDIKYYIYVVSLCLPANWLLSLSLSLEWPLLSTSVSRSKWAVIVAMINGHSRRQAAVGRRRGRNKNEAKKTLCWLRGRTFRWSDAGICYNLRFVLITVPLCWVYDGQREGMREKERERDGMVHSFV